MSISVSSAAAPQIPPQLTAQDYLDRGMSYKIKGDPQSAAREYELGLQLNPPSSLRFSLLKEIGRMHMHLKLSQYEKAEAELKEALQLYQNRPQTCNLDRAKASGFNDRKRVHIVNIDPFAIVEPRELSRGSKSKFEGDSGIASPDDIKSIYGDLAFVLSIQNRNNEALEYVLTGLKFPPDHDHLRLLRNLADLLLKGRPWFEAEKEYLQISGSLNLDANYQAYLYGFFADVLMNSQKEGASDALEKGFKIEGASGDTKVELHITQAKFHELRKDYKAVIDSYQEGLKWAPPGSSNYDTLVELIKIAARDSGAIVVIIPEAPQIHPKISAQDYLERGGFWEKRKEYSLAAIEYRFGLQKNPPPHLQLKLLLHMATVFKLDKKPELAIAAYREALPLTDPWGKKPIYCEMASIASDQNKKEEARKYIFSGLEIPPFDINGRLLRASGSLNYKK